jgi:hypothetical protein
MAAEIEHGNVAAIESITPTLHYGQIKAITPSCVQETNHTGRRARRRFAA